MTIGEKIKELRLKKGLTQKKLGDMCGLADSAIRRYERGGAKPKYETLAKISAALGIPIEEILPNSIESDISIGAEFRATDYEFLQSLVDYKVFNEEERKRVASKIDQYENDIEKIGEHEKVIKYGEKSQEELCNIILKMLLGKIPNEEIPDIIILLSFFIGLSERNRQHIITFLAENIY